MKPEKQAKRENITLTILKEDHRLFKLLSMAKGRSMSVLLSDFIRNAVKKIDLSKLIPDQNSEEI